MEKMKLKGVKIQETFDDFLKMHPEIKLNRDEDGDVINIAPATSGVDIRSQTIINNEPMQIVYEYQGKEIMFPPLH